jgi:hypothetical protein
MSDSNNTYRLLRDFLHPNVARIPFPRRTSFRLSCASLFSNTTHDYNIKNLKDIAKNVHLLPTTIMKGE